MIATSTIALAIMAGIFVYMGINANSEPDKFNFLRLIFITLGLLLIMTFFLLQGGLYSAYTVYLPTNSTAVMTYENQGTINGLSQIYYGWAMAMAFVILIYITIEIIVYRIVAMAFRKAQKETGRIGR